MRTGFDVAGAVDDALALLEAEHGRSAQVAVGASEIGECARLVKWTADGRPATDVDEPSLVAGIGTAVHAWLLPALARVLDDPFALVEQRVTARLAGVGIPGTLDLFAHRRVVDLKTKHNLDGVRKYGASTVEIAQVATYVLGLEQAGERVDGATLLYVDRAYGDRLSIDLDRDEIGEVLEVLEAFLARALVDDAAPRVDVTGADRRAGDRVCRYCRFRTACWGDPPRPALVLEEGAVDLEDALRGLADAAEREKQGKTDRAWWASVLEDTPAGTYGSLVLKRKRGTAPGLALDAEEAERRLAEAGLEVPYKPTNGRRPSLSVVPAES